MPPASPRRPRRARRRSALFGDVSAFSCAGSTSTASVIVAFPRPNGHAWRSCGPRHEHVDGGRDPSDAFRTKHLERILDVGDASSVARALAYEAALEAHVGGPLLEWHAPRLLGHARRLVARTGDPYDAAWFQLGIANRAYCSGRFRAAAEACDASLGILRSRCRGVAWEIRP